jgi:GTP-binding protein Era
MTGPMLQFRCGTIAVVGRPNVGKSTLVNALVGERISITSRKAHTTRHRIRAVLTRPDAQFVFVDTPGLQWRTHSLLADRLNVSAAGALAEVDVVLMVIEAGGWRPEDDRIVSLLKTHRVEPARVVLAVNKTDRLRQRDALLPLIEAVRGRFEFAAIVPVSAEKGAQLEDLLGQLMQRLPAGEPMFEPDQLTDRSVRFLAGELVREKAIRLLGDEIPYGLAVTIEQWTENAGRALIEATLWVERESHRGIVIGAGAAKLREIGRSARTDIERLLGKPVHLQTRVKLAKRWRDDEAGLAKLGYGAAE